MSSSFPERQREDPAPGLRLFARTALLVEPLTGGAIFAVMWSVTYLGGREAALAATGAALVVAAVAAVPIRARRRFSGVRALVLATILLVLGGAGVLTAVDSLDTPLLPVLVVLCGGPAAWVVLWPARAVTGLLRFGVAAALVVPLGFVAFAVGSYVTPFVLLTALALWLAYRAFPPLGSPAPTAAVTAGAALVVVCGGVAAWLTSPGSSAFFLAAAFSAPTVAVLLVAAVPRRLPTVHLVIVVVLLIAALAVDVWVVLPTVAEGGDFGPRLAAGAAFGHLGVMWAAAAPGRDRSSGASSGDPCTTSEAGVSAS